MSNVPQCIDPKKALLQVRIIWAALLGGVVLFGVVIGFMQFSGAGPAAEQIDQQTVSMLFYIALGMLFAMIPAGIFLRGQFFKAGWEGQVVRPGSYVQGSIIALACCEGPALFGLVVVMLAGSFWPYVLAPAIGLAAMALLFPNGRAMFPPKDAYAIGER